MSFLEVNIQKLTRYCYAFVTFVDILLFSPLPSAVCYYSQGSVRVLRFRLPLHDPVRLQQWLRSTRRENYTPNRHQYICHEHFDPSCFKMRCGERCLESDAVPTFFQEVEVKPNKLTTESFSFCTVCVSFLQS